MLFSGFALMTEKDSRQPVARNIRRTLTKNELERR